MSQSAVYVNKAATCFKDNVNDSGISAEESINIEHLADINVFDVEKCVKQLTDRQFLGKLTDQTRNRTVNKVVVDRRFGGELLIGESDDFLVTYDCAHDGLFQWFLKHEPDQYVRHLLPCLQAWPPADAKRYKHATDMLYDKLDTLLCLFNTMLN